MKEKGYKVRSIKFIRIHQVYNDDYIFIYEIALNKSIGNAGRIKGIEKGLDEYTESEFKIKTISFINKIFSYLPSFFKKKQ